jgi:hypothetical protein
MCTRTWSYIHVHIAVYPRGGGQEYLCTECARSLGVYVKFAQPRAPPPILK